MFIQKMKVRNLLSFGPDTEELELKPLNVLIGPNGSGKSNFIEIMGLLKAVPDKLMSPIVDGGGIGEWLWRGKSVASLGELEVEVSSPGARGQLRYHLALRNNGNLFHVGGERLELIALDPDVRPRLYLESDGRSATVWRDSEGELQESREGIIPHPQQSLISRYKRSKFLELSYLADEFGRIALFRESSFGRGHPARTVQQPDQANEFLVEDASNLGLVLSRLMSEYDARRHLIESLKALYEGVTDYRVDIQRSEVRLFLSEGDVSVPATRLSDGTLHYLCLLAILCHPNPPPVVCLEEPELGLHPDILPDLAGLLRTASERCQLVVTTHSDVMVDALTDTPESVVICEKRDGATTMRRLDADELSHWLGTYRLGELWSAGELGGNRW